MLNMISKNQAKWGYRVEAIQATYGVVGGLIGLGLAIYAIVACFMKSKPVLGIAGILGFGLLSVIGAIRLAKPDSSWAMKRYDRTHLALSQGRFPDRVSAEDRVTKPQLEEDLDGWTARPPHATQLLDALNDRLGIPGQWVVSETPNDVTYRKPLVPHVVMLLATLLLIPLWPIVGGVWLYLALVADERRHRLTFADGTGVTEEKLGRAERSYPVGLSRTAWREAPEAEPALV